MLDIVLSCSKIMRDKNGPTFGFSAGSVNSGINIIATLGSITVRRSQLMNFWKTRMSETVLSCVLLPNFARFVTYSGKFESIWTKTFCVILGIDFENPIRTHTDNPSMLLSSRKRWVDLRNLLLFHLLSLLKVWSITLSVSSILKAW